MKNIQENQKLVASGLVGLGLYSAGVMGYGPTIGLSQTLTFSATWLVQQLIGSFASIAVQTAAGMMLAGATAAIATAFTAWFISKAINLAMAKFAPVKQDQPNVENQENLDQSAKPA